MTTSPRYVVENETLLRGCIEIMDFYEDDVYFFVVRLLKSSVTDETWKATMHNMRVFMRFIQSKKIKYHFIFDIHLCESIPLDRLADLQHFLQRKKDILNANLHSSVVFTSNAAIELLLRSAFNFVTPIRPITILLANVETAEERYRGLPSSVWTEAMDYLRANRSA